MGKGKVQQKIHGTKGAGPSKYHSAEQRQGRRFLFVWLPVIVVVVLLFYAFAFDPPKPFGQPVPGKSKQGEQSQSGDTVGKAYVIALDDGRTVKLDGTQMGILEPDRRVLVQENVTLIFKRRSFTFVQYIK